MIDADGSYLGKYRKTHIPQVKGFWEKFYFRPGNMGTRSSTPRSAGSGCTSATTGTSQRLAALGLARARIVFNPSATSRGLSQYLWRLEQPASAVANEYFIGAINRSASSRSATTTSTARPLRGPARAALGDAASDDKDEVLVHDLDMEQLAEVRNLWQVYRDHRPDHYSLVQP